MGKGSRKSPNRKTGRRTASGALSRSKAAKQERQEVEDVRSFAEAPQQVVWQARRRQQTAFQEPENSATWRSKQLAPVTKAEVQKHGLDLAGSILGRLVVQGELTKEEMAAGEDYCDRYLRYTALNGLPRPTPRMLRYSAVKGRANTADRIEAAVAVKKAHFRDRRALDQCGEAVRLAVEQASVHDQPAPIKALKIGLNALIECRKGAGDKTREANAS